MSSTHNKMKNKSCLYDIFIRATLGRYLPSCLQEVAELKPADPIEFIARWLYKVYDSHIYYKQKMKFLKELCEADKVLKKEKTEHAEKLKPFAEEMRAERWKYYVSLREELEALTDFVQNVDVAVDEKSKQRYLEVQNLVRQEEVHLQSIEQSLKASSSVQAKSTKSTKSDTIVEATLSSSAGQILTRSFPDNANETTAIVKFKSNERSKETTRTLDQTSRRQRLVHGAHKSVRKHRSRSAVQCLRMHPRVATTAVKSSPSNLTLELLKDSDISMLSTSSKDGSACHSCASYSTDLGFKQHYKHPGNNQLQTSNLFRYVLDEVDSGSGLCSTEPGRCSSDSEMEPLVASSEYCDMTKVREMHEARLDFAARSGDQLRDYTTTPTSQGKLRYVDGVLSFYGEDNRSQTLRTYGKLSEEGSFTSSTYTTSGSIAGCTKLPRLTSQSDVMQQILAAGQVREQKPSLEIKPCPVSRGAGRSMKLTSKEKKGTEYQGMVDDDGHESETLQVQEDIKSSFIEQTGTPERLHLPPLRVQRVSRRSTSSEDKTSAGGDQYLNERYMVSPELAVQLPAIPPTCQTTGTLIMTNGGHIAYISKEFGVVASNSLKIRNPHPLDKPEMWEQRRFQCQSFYDHELYSQNDIHALYSDDEDEFRYKDIRRMTMEEFIGPPSRKWNRKGEKRPP